ncbi:tetratricopeptide repeat protein [Trichlorobacter lovleyi]|uniref:Tetratricopeptide domain protein n=1 Tax=Trichlorobacter lovleyi (strain ATCC BAA-1151 / DSM 17278 / SZ) TaxID=398767 RepID=B3E560_TRIL1|nr:tetratricopeptide repeat protein [Trichlorobacter lovleyi]ACD96047.1 Tetratricopeptide domain protein [Trichlorobacter lovleyi SZ]
MEHEKITDGDDNLLHRLRLLYELERYEELLKLAQPHLADPATEPQIFSYAAEAAVQREEFAKAQSILRHGLAANPGSTTLRAVQISLLNHLELYREALAAAEAALELDPDCSTIWYLQSVTHYNRHDLNAAESSILKALSLDPLDIDYLAHHASILWIMDKNDQARQMVLEGLAQQPDHAELLYLHAQMEKSRSKAANILQRLLGSSPTSTEAQQQYRALTSRFQLTCLIAGVLTLGHALLRYLLTAGWFPHLPKLVAEDGVLFLAGLAGLGFAKDTMRNKRLLYFYVVCNLELVWIGDNLKGEHWVLGLGVGVAAALLIGLLFTWALFFYRAMFDWSVSRIALLWHAYQTAASNGFKAEWIREQLHNPNLLFMIGGGLIPALVTLLDPSGEFYANALLCWFGLLLVLLPLVRDVAFSTAFSAVVVCLLAYIPVIDLLRWLPALVPFSPLLAVLALAGGSLATAFGLRILAADTD